jgi:hypothetical protein
MIVLENHYEGLLQDYDAWAYTADLSYSKFEKFCVPLSSIEYKTIFDSKQSGIIKASNAKENISISFNWVAYGGEDSYEAAHEFVISPDLSVLETDGFEFVGTIDELTDLLTGREWESAVRAIL